MSTNILSYRYIVGLYGTPPRQVRGGVKGCLIPTNKQGTCPLTTPHNTQNNRKAHRHQVHIGRSIFSDIQDPILSITDQAPTLDACMHAEDASESGGTACFQRPGRKSTEYITGRAAEDHSSVLSMPARSLSKQVSSALPTTDACLPY